MLRSKGSVSTMLRSLKGLEGRHEPFQRGIQSSALTIAQVPESERLRNLPKKEDLTFGTVFSDHMLVIEWDNGRWHAPSIVPYGNLSISPAVSSLHYGAYRLSTWKPR